MKNINKSYHTYPNIRCNFAFQINFKEDSDQLKNIFKIFGVSFLISIYCFAVVVIQFNGLKSSLISHSEGKTEKQLYSISSTSNVSHTSQSESTFQVNKNLNNATSYNLLYQGFFTGLRIVNLNYISKFTQYIFFGHSFLIKHRKADLIFPFHYFW